MTTGSSSRPAFRPISQGSTSETPEDLWNDLRPVRSHEFLRGPQQEVFRKYPELAKRSDVALELPTGTGKTAVALLIAEWRRRRHGRPVTYLTLTNQLARQALEEASRLGLRCADLRGSRSTRDRTQVGRYTTADAVGITTYSNLFNVNPVVVESDLLVLDDVHGGEEFVASMWTLRVPGQTPLYDELLAALGPALSARQRRSLEQGGAGRSPDIVHLAGATQCVGPVTKVLEGASEDPTIRFAWRAIRQNLDACIVLASNEGLTIRPLVPPTHSHPQFASSTQRLYLSATLGDPADLRRAYGVGNITHLRSSQEQTGRRFIFAPSTYASDDDTAAVVAAFWDELEPKRALMITPSEQAAVSAFLEISNKASATTQRMRASDVTDSLDPFTTSSGTILTAPSRYDGIDLPHDACRLMLLAGSPSAVGELERHLRDRWAAGPVLRARERTRFVQGLGRCTRGDTDYAIVVLMGQAISDLVARPRFVEALPAHIRAEVRWGRGQSDRVASDASGFVDMLRGIVSDNDYRAEADGMIVEQQKQEEAGATEDSETAAHVVSDELRYARSMWDGYYQGAYQAARAAADSLGTEAMSGYRAWWWYLASDAAERGGYVENAADCRSRALACGINRGFIQDLPELSGTSTTTAPSSIAGNADGVWGFIDQTVGWAGERFGRFVDTLLSEIGDDEPTRFHMGLERLGQLLGADSTRRTEPGVPDVVWSFEDDTHIAIEAKTDKGSDSNLSKRDIQQAVGHANWVAANLAADPPRSTIRPIVVSSASRLDDLARPHVDDLARVDPSALRELAAKAVAAVRTIRASFSGRDYAEAVHDLSQTLTRDGLDEASIVATLTADKLAESN